MVNDDYTTKGPRKYDSGSQMSDYEKDRDKAAYQELLNSNHQCPPGKDLMQSMFISGADWAHARAEDDIELWKNAEHNVRDLLNEKTELLKAERERSARLFEFVRRVADSVPTEGTEYWDLQAKACDLIREYKDE